MDYAINADLPVLGICLGAQVHASGGRAYAGHGPEVGTLSVAFTPAAATEPLLHDVSMSEMVGLQWHGDTFELPPGATLLASSDMYPNQVFRYRNALGIQFHLEVTAAMAAEWATVPAYAAALDSVRGPGSLPGLLDEFETHRPAMEVAARAIAENFVALIRLCITERESTGARMVEAGPTRR